MTKKDIWIVHMNQLKHIQLEMQRQTDLLKERIDFQEKLLEAEFPQMATPNNLINLT